MTVVLRLNTSQSMRALRNLKTQAPVAIARALNKSIASGKTVMVRLLSADMGVKQSDLRDKIRVVEATPERQTAKLTASAKRIPLYDFRARGPVPSRGRGRGVTARLPGGAGRYPNAFIAKMPTGHVGVFQRKPGAHRLPIYELFGPSIAKVFEKHVAEGLRRANEQLRKNLRSELRFVMRQAAA
jgi:hypothetical protein